MWFELCCNNEPGCCDRLGRAAILFVFGDRPKIIGTRAGIIIATHPAEPLFEDFIFRAECAASK